MVASLVVDFREGEEKVHKVVLAMVQVLAQVRAWIGVVLLAPRYLDSSYISILQTRLHSQIHLLSVNILQTETTKYTILRIT